MTALSKKFADFEHALKRACLRAVARASRYEPLRGGDITAVVYGPLIGEIADEADLSVPQTRRRLQALQREGKVIRDDRRGGSTAWWLVGLAEAPRAAAGTPAPAPAAPHQTVTATVPARQHWSDVLGVARDCSTRDATRAYRLELARLLESDDLEAPNDLMRLKEAYSACCREHEIQIEE
ncbi:FaeA-like protein [Luteibacter sp. UNC138MFCol5.1]|uniref:FaeA/PapI family transcriptional regulator n=1 Tax=Luteibacter sp. UNC138MFCol5.1 TaxID=1502774 RepID=UPI0008C1B334|nr:FaeA/PapI family transcriptional regulator [Luteibacter sp. UNC138MFCol5.1]SEO64168.1 FaeA-like protein [Luteibacter sp. UNC138MFCol5.1]